jgi:hypothetical protein
VSEANCDLGHACCTDPSLGPHVHSIWVPTEECPRCITIRALEDEA